MTSVICCSYCKYAVIRSRIAYDASELLHRSVQLWHLDCGISPCLAELQIKKSLI